MEILFFLIPVSVVLVSLGIWAFIWAVRSGQFDDLEGPAHRILMDDADDNVAGGHYLDKDQKSKDPTPE